MKIIDGIQKAVSEFRQFNASPPAILLSKIQLEEIIRSPFMTECSTFSPVYPNQIGQIAGVPVFRDNEMPDKCFIIKELQRVLEEK